jgi:hypothetical protein
MQTLGCDYREFRLVSQPASLWHANRRSLDAHWFPVPEIEWQQAEGTRVAIPLPLRIQL